jgi:hypothetical protein
MANLLYPIIKVYIEEARAHAEQRKKSPLPKTTNT